MHITVLQPGGSIYTSNAFFITGTWNRIEDVNTLIDTGKDPVLLRSLDQARNGVGKRRVEQVVLTHSHYDHIELLTEVIERFQPCVYAFSEGLPGVTQLLQHGQCLRFGDAEFEVLHTPGHSSDSACFYCAAEKVLFSGDTPLVINSAEGSYEDAFIAALENLCRLDVRAIYFGHGAPLLDGCNDRLRLSLSNVLGGIRRC